MKQRKMKMSKKNLKIKNYKYFELIKIFTYICNNLKFDLRVLNKLKSFQATSKLVTNRTIVGFSKIEMLSCSKYKAL